MTTSMRMVRLSLALVFAWVAGACSSDPARTESTAPPPPEQSAAPVPTPTPTPPPTPPTTTADAAAAAAVPTPTAPTGTPTTTPPTDPGAGTTPGGDAKPKNIVALPSSWSTSRVKDYMKKDVAAALGVKCNHCHDPGNFAADHPKKKIGLEMIQMVMRVNQNVFKGKQRVTCNTCHLGKLKPRE